MFRVFGLKVSSFLLLDQGVAAHVSSQRQPETVQPSRQPHSKSVVRAEKLSARFRRKCGCVGE